MKKTFIVVLLAGILMTSCAGFPKPEADTDTLVIGSFVLDFPDAFFAEPPRKIDSGVRLDFLNVTKQKPFSIVTSKGGYFYFLANGGDQYQITSYAYNVTVQNGGYYYGGSQIRVGFTSLSGVVHYIGHFTYTFAHPTMTRTGSTGTNWHFQTSTLREYRKDDVTAYLQAAAPDSPWVSREMKSF